MGRRDVPTDGVRDYCQGLDEALRRRGRLVQQVAMDWDVCGWLGAWRHVWRRSRDWRGAWVCLQYTALAWSRRGFPAAAIAVLVLLRWRGARCAVTFHDVRPYGGSRLPDLLRNRFQLWTMRCLSRIARRSILTVPLDVVSPLPVCRSKTVFIPVGSNIPAADAQGSWPSAGQPGSRGTPSVAVFCFTDGRHTDREAAETAYVAKCAAEYTERLRLVALGRGSDVARQALEQKLRGSGIELRVLGLLPAEQVAREIAACDVLLSVRPIFANRGSIIAAIGCGVPIVGYGDPLTSYPVSEAGTALVAPGNLDALASSLIRVLTDKDLRKRLAQRSQMAQALFFSWDAVANRYTAALSSPPAKSRAH